ncbi:DEBR0S1_05578g1_1 [Brettanomyces bruxellensis]|uniref:DEBR0S1_05578g1_1 n=1 Tax=Dekkera bruxellensis TaxID=5007 RepID=A0A7D9GZ30_DEKBR|nr:DEBR0S1_05578g1_1 [Brettanomyces bruxellensis]
MVWEEAIDDKGQVYYYDTETDKTQWERPAQLKNSKLDELLRQFGWETYKTDNGETYYFNTKDEKSVWELPEEVKKELNIHLSAKSESKEVSESNTEPTGTPVVVNNVHQEGETESSINWEQGQKQTDTYKSTTGESEANQLIGLKELLRQQDADESDGISSGASKNEIQNSNEGEQEDMSKKRFLSMLAEKKVELDWPFAKVSQECIDDGRYWQIEDPLQRKQLFEVYLIGKREEEYKKVQESRQKYLEQFREILKKHDIQSYTRWKTCEKEIANESICISIPKALQKQFFQSYIQQLKEKEKEQLDQRRDDQLNRLEEEMTAAVKVNSRIEEFMKAIDLTGKYPDLNKVDVITIYDMVKMKKVDEFKQIIAKNKKLNERADRKARDSFKKMLKEKEERYPEKFTANMKWYEFLGLIRSEESFIELCGHNGSSAIDYYWDILDAKNQILRTKVDYCMRLMNNHQLELKSFEGEVKKFRDTIKKVIEEQDSKTDVSDTELTEIFEVLKRREDEEKERRNRKRTLTERESSNKKQKLPRLGYGVLQ